MGIEREAEQVTNGATNFTNCSYMMLKLHTRGIQESRKEYYFSDLLVVEAIWIDQRSEVNQNQLAIMKIARSQAAIAKHAEIRRAAAAVSQWSLEDSGSVKVSILGPWENELALVLDTLVRHVQCANWSLVHAKRELNVEWHGIYTPFSWNGMEWKRHCFYAFYCMPY